MAIRIIHGNGDLIGGALQGVSQGVENFQAGQQAQAERARAEQVAANLAEQLRMDQEAHAQGVKLFNQQMFDREATQNWRAGTASMEGPNKYQQMRESLAQAPMSEAARAQALEVLGMEEMAAAREQSAMGYRGRIGELMRQNQQFAEMSPVLQGLMDPQVLQDTAPEDLPALLNSVEDEVRMLRQQARDDAAVFQMGQRLDTLSNDANLGYAMQEQIPRIIEGMADRYPPQAMNNLLAGLTGEVPMSRLMDGGATEAAMRDYMQQRAREELQRQAGADAANMSLGGGGQAAQAMPAPSGPPKNFMEEVAARKQARESVAQEVQTLEQGLSTNAWQYRQRTDKNNALIAFRDELAKSPEAFQDEAAYTALMEKHGLDPNDPGAAEAAANAASMREADFGTYLGQTEGGEKQREADKAKLRALKRGGAAAPELYRMVAEAAQDPTGELWKNLPKDAEQFKQFFNDPTKRRKVSSAMEALTSQNPKL